MLEHAADAVGGAEAVGSTYSHETSEVFLDVGARRIMQKPTDEWVP